MAYHNHALLRARHNRAVVAEKLVVGLGFITYKGKGGLSMNIQLGPVECEPTVGKLLRALTAEYPGITVLEKVPGGRANCCQSVLLRADEDLSHLEGAVRWVCRSPYRPGHKRKTRLVDVSLWGEAAYAVYD